MRNTILETPEDFYSELMALRAAGAQPPYIFVFRGPLEVKEFLDACSPEDHERFAQDDVHLVIEVDGEFYRFTGLVDNRSTFETPPFTIQ